MGRKIHKTHIDINRLWTEHTDEQTETYVSKKALLPLFKVGTLVWLRNDGDISKLAPKWKGPYKVLEQKTDVTYMIDFNRGTLINVDRLKSYHIRLSNSTHDIEQDAQHVASLLSSANHTAAAYARSRDQIQLRHDELKAQLPLPPAISPVISVPVTTAPTVTVPPHTTTTATTTSTTASITTTTTSARRVHIQHAPLVRVLTQPSYAGVMRAQTRHINYSEQRE